jgi:hypothetical protein
MSRTKSEVLKMWRSWESEGYHPEECKKKSPLERSKELQEIQDEFDKIQAWLSSEKLRARYANYPWKYLEIEKLKNLMDKARCKFVKIYLPEMKK